MNSNSLVSIITPAYKAAGVVGEAIRSVVDQDYQEWQMLIADDCSPDDTRDVVEEWCARDERIKLICLEKNGGPAAARNAALEIATGRWVAFLDSDDIWLPQKLRRQVAFHSKSGAKITYTSGRRFSATRGAAGHRIRIPGRLDYRQLLGNTAIITSTVLVDTELTGPVRMKQTYYDDFACWLEILRSGGWAAGLDEDLLRYRVSVGSVSRNKLRSAREVWQTYRNVERIGIPMAAWYFTNYAARALIKYRKF
jgi:teichuronic acid biosynthesis glycosyltransferase TuaG